MGVILVFWVFMVLAYCGHHIYNTFFVEKEY